MSMDSGDCKERVAFDLARLIKEQEHQSLPQKRGFWFVLYNQCLKAVDGQSLDALGVIKGPPGKPLPK